MPLTLADMHRIQQEERARAALRYLALLRGLLAGPPPAKIRLQAKDIPDTAILGLFPHADTCLWTADVLARLPAYPPKLLRAKLRALRRRNLLHACGCRRGDWHLPCDRLHD
jgi:hypothetical protein